MINSTFILLFIIYNYICIIYKVYIIHSKFILLFILKIKNIQNKNLSYTYISIYYTLYYCLLGKVKHDFVPVWNLES